MGKTDHAGGCGSTGPGGAIFHCRSYCTQKGPKLLVRRAIYPNNLPFQPSEIFQGQRDLAEVGALPSGILLVRLHERLAKKVAKVTTSNLVGWRVP